MQTKCFKMFKKTTGNIGYILTEFEEKNTTEFAQQILFYCKVLFIVKVIFKITLLFLSPSDCFQISDSDSQWRSIKYKSHSLACFILAIGSTSETLPSYHEYYN